MIYLESVTNIMPKRMSRYKGIQLLQFTDGSDNIDECLRFCSDNNVQADKVFNGINGNYTIEIGSTRVWNGDYIVISDNGTFTVVKQDKFEKEYDVI